MSELQLISNFVSEPSLEPKGSRARHLLQSKARSITVKRLSAKTKLPKQILRSRMRHGGLSVASHAVDHCDCGECAPTAVSGGPQPPSRERYVVHQPVSSRQSSSELRSLRFYREKTSVEWSGWYDNYFWTELVPAIAQDYEAVSFALTALAAGHESLEVDNAHLRRFCIAQAGKSITWMNDHQHDVSWPVWITQCIIVAQLAALVHAQTYARCLKVLDDILRSMKTDEYCLRGLVQRIVSQHCQQMDPLPSLRKWTPVEGSPILSMPDFASLPEAREYLEKVLNTVVFQIKNHRHVERDLLSWWLTSFLRLQDRCDILGWKVLKAAYGMSVVQINTFNSTNETDFDQYLEVFSEVADMYEAVVRADDKEAQYRFNVDAGLMCLVMWAAKWCREPAIRTRLIALSLTKRRQEGIYSSSTWARVLEVVKGLEERGIHPRPLSCLQIPGENRVRWHSLHLDLGASMIKLEVLYYPYTGSPQDIWIPFDPNGCVHLSESVAEASAEGFCSSIIQGTAHVAWLTSRETMQYYVTQSDTFYFVLPRC